MSLSVGTKVGILSTGDFNETFVKVGDIAEIILTSDWEMVLISSGWKYEQYTSSSFEGLDFEVIEEK